MMYLNTSRPLWTVKRQKVANIYQKYPSSQLVSVEFLRGQSGRGVKLTTHLQLLPTSSKRGSMHVLPHKPSYRSVLLVKHRNHFAFIYGCILTSRLHRAVLQLYVYGFVLTSCLHMPVYSFRLYIYIYMCVCVCVCVFWHLFIKAKRQNCIIELTAATFGVLTVMTVKSTKFTDISEDLIAFIFRFEKWWRHVPDNSTPCTQVFVEAVDREWPFLTRSGHATKSLIQSLFLISWKKRSYSFRYSNLFHHTAQLA
jgi:hypothetical protein